MRDVELLRMRGQLDMHQRALMGPWERLMWLVFGTLPKASEPETSIYADAPATMQAEQEPLIVPVSHDDVAALGLACES